MIKIKEGKASDETVKAVWAIARALSHNKQDIEVKTVESGHVLGIEVKVNAEDMPAMIGESGRHVGAMNELLWEVADREQIRLVINLVEPTKGEKRGPRPFPKEARKGQAVAEISKVLSAIFPAGCEIKEQGTSSITILHLTPAHPEEDLSARAWAGLLVLIRAIGKVNGRIVEAAYAA